MRARRRPNKPIFHGALDIARALSGPFIRGQRPLISYLNIGPKALCYLVLLGLRPNKTESLWPLNNGLRPLFILVILGPEAQNNRMLYLLHGPLGALSSGPEAQIYYPFAPAAQSFS